MSKKKWEALEERVIALEKNNQGRTLAIEQLPLQSVCAETFIKKLADELEKAISTVNQDY